MARQSREPPLAQHSFQTPFWEDAVPAVMSKIEWESLGLSGLLGGLTINSSTAPSTWHLGLQKLQSRDTLVSLSCQPCERSPQLWNCLDQVGLWVCLWRFSLSIDVGGSSSLGSIIHWAHGRVCVCVANHEPLRESENELVNNLLPWDLHQAVA